MAVVSSEVRAKGFNKAARKCMNCGKELPEANDLYSRRFCSVECKEDYCDRSKSILGNIKSV